MPTQPSQPNPYCRWLVHGLCWGMVACTTLLSVWQWQRAQDKTQLITQHTARQHAPISNDIALFSEPSARFRRVQLTGHFDTAHPVWYASQFHDHQVGYNIWLPFLPDANPARWLWVNMGWVPQNAAHAAWPQNGTLQTTGKPPLTQNPMPLPTLPPTSQTVTALGIVDTLPHTHIWGMRNNSLHPHWPLISVQPDWTRIAHALHRDFYPLSWRLTTHQPGWEREHHWVVLPPSRHKAYAAQWLAMALVLLVWWHRYFRRI